MSLAAFLPLQRRLREVLNQGEVILTPGWTGKSDRSLLCVAGILKCRS